MSVAATVSESPGAATARNPELRESLIDRDSHFNGLYETKQDLCIEGLAEGEIQCQGTLTVAEGARVKAKVTANTITIAGELDGEVICRGVFQILPSGQVQASVSARRLIVQEGGLYNGEFRMITTETPPAEANETGLPQAVTPPAGDGDTGPEIGSDEWWKKFNEGELTGAGDSQDDRLSEKP
jgi:cytoskeletal protein CcmA (bactofilin family)